MRETGMIYGGSLYALAAEEGADSEIKAQLDALGEIFTENADFFSAMDAPQIPKDEKLKTADAVFEGCHPYVVNTIKLLIERRSLFALGYLVKAYNKAYNKAHNIAEVTAITAVPLEAEAAEAIKTKLKERLGKEIVLTNKVDASVLGGVVIRTDGLQIDGGVRTRLDEIKKEIVR